MFLIDMFNKKIRMPGPEDTLPGRATAIATSQTHFVNGRALHGPYPDGLEIAYFALGCFWAATYAVPSVPLTARALRAA